MTDLGAPVSQTRPNGRWFFVSWLSSVNNVGITNSVLLPPELLTALLVDGRNDTGVSSERPVSFPTVVQNLDRKSYSESGG